MQIRPVEPRDAAGINALRRMPGVFENILGIPSEREKRNRELLENLDQNLHMFVAVEVDSNGVEQVIGSANLAVYPNPRQRHVGGIGIMVHKDYQGQGVGTKLMNTLLDIADNWLMLVRIELTVFADNDRAIHVYEKLGFGREGIKRYGAIRNGAYVDELMMARIRKPKLV